MTSGKRQNGLPGREQDLTTGQTVVFRGTFAGHKEAEVVLIDHESGAVTAKEPFRPVPFCGSEMEAVVRNVDKKRTDYVFLADGQVVIDPKARLIRGRERFGSFEKRHKYQIRCAFPEDDFPWGEDEAAPHIPWEQVIAYCLHVRGFTKHAGSKVSDRGTFSGLAQKAGYLKELGVNQIILMPCYEFEEVEERRAPMPPHLMREDEEIPSRRKLNYWGFGKSWYFAPKAGFCATGQPDTEFKTMVRTMHAQGTEVVMEFAFPDDVPEDLALEALRYWHQVYHVDGFLLLCRSTIAYMAAHDALLDDCKLITGYFDPAIAYPHGRKQPYRHLASCNDGFRTDMRKALKGDADMISAFVERTRQDGDDVACVNYMTSHDGFTMMDLVSYDRKHNDENGEFGRDGAESEYSWNCGVEGPSRKRAITDLRVRQIRNAFAMLLLSRGTPMILAGDELGNSQGGNNNPYCIDSPVTWVEWSSRKISQDILDFVKKLIAFRKAHPMLTGVDRAAARQQLSCGYPDFSCHSDRAWFGAFDYQTRHTGLMHCAVEHGEETILYAAYNFHWDPQTFAIPYLPQGMEWTIALDTSRPGDDGADEEIQKEFVLPGRTVRVLISRRKPDGKET